MLAGAGIATSRGQEPGLTVHEWGTFTSLQDETGRAIGGINTDDEPVPNFVNNVAGMLLLPPTEVPPIFFQGAPSCHPDVTMRLETPVLYFHAPASFHGPVDVHVSFNGGWLTQFYPAAICTAPGIALPFGHFGPLTTQTVGKLDWAGLEVNAGGEGPATAEHVWLAPRAVQASPLRTPEGENEKFLFYRGVGHLDAPLRVTRSPDGASLALMSGEAMPDLSNPIKQCWLVDIRPDGTAAYRTLGPIPLGCIVGGQFTTPSITMPAVFAPADYTATTVDRLRSDLRTALVAKGLFADEADALLNTWQLSYFKSAGLRVFFLVPQPWTDRVLPLTITGAPSVTRVMVGRIELVSPRQRELLARLVAAPAMTPQSLFTSFDVLRSKPQPEGGFTLWNEVFAGKKSLAQAGVAVPEAYRTYLELGRFRNALILDEERRGGNARLAEFIKTCHLEGYTVSPGTDPAH